MATTTEFNDGQWRHVVATYDGQTAKIYVDGVLENTATITGPIDTSNHVVEIGRNSEITYRHWGGDLSDVRVYSYALPETQIQSLYNGLLLHWKLDESSGTLAEDASGHDRHGTVDSTVSRGSGVRGYAAELDADEAITHQDLLGRPESLTLACWVNADAVASNGGELITLGNYMLVRVDSPTTGGFAAVHLRRNGSWDTSVRATEALVGAGWRHVAATFDDATRTIRLYIDGELVDTGTTAYPIEWTASLTDYIALGRHTSTGTSAYDLTGAVDDIRIYERAISATEVKELYGLLAHYKLDETSGTTAADSSGVGNDGTYENAPTLGTAALRGYAATFDSDAAAQHVDVPNTVLDGASTVSVSWWMKTTHTGQQAVLSAANSTVAAGNELLLFFNNSTTLQVFVEGTSVSHSIDSIADDRWRHFVYQLDRVSGVERVYIDGELAVDSSRTATTNTLAVDSGGLVLAQDQDSVGGSFGSGQDLEADLDDVRIYDRMLSEEEIAELYGLLLHLKLDESSGSVAADSSPLGHDGAITGAPLQGESGLRGTAYEFATGDEIEVAQSDALDSACTADNQAFAVAFWVKPRTETTTWHSIFQKGTSNVPRGPGVWIDDGGNDLHLAMATTTSSNWGDDNGYQLPLDQWTHVVVQATGGQLEWYINGSLQRTRTIGGTIVGAAGPIYIGQTYSYQPPGRLDDIRFYNRALDTHEIAELFGLVGHWKLDESSGTAAADSSPFGHDGTYTGAPTLGGAGLRGLATEFPANSDYVRVGTTSVLDRVGADDGDFTAAMWIKAGAADTGTWRTVFFKGTSGTDRKPGLWLHPSDNRLNFSTGTTAHNWEGLVSTEELPEGEWSHIVLRKNAGAMQIFIDGKLHRSSSLSGTSLASSGDLFLGGSSVWTCSNSQIDDVVFYNRAMTDEEIAEHFGLVGRWRLDETSGSVAADDTVRAWDGDYMNAPLLASDTPHPSSDNTVELDGSNEHVALGTTEVDFSGGVGLSIWVKPKAYNSWARFFELSNGEDAENILFGQEGTTNRVRFDLWDGSAGGQTSLNASSAIELDRWQHFVATIDGAGNAKIYRNGVEVSSGFLGLPADATRTVNYLGRSAWSHNAYYEGGMADARVYNRYITPREVAQLYGLVGRWKLDETSGTVAADSSLMAGDGLILGNPTTNVEGPRDGDLAMSFDGVDDAVMLPDFAAGTFQEGVTLAGWVKPSVTANYQKFLQLSQGTSASLEFGRGNGGDHLRGYESNGGTSLYVNDGINVNVWRHYAMTIDTNGYMRLYRNGVLLSERTGITIPNSARATNTIADSQWGNPLFQGDLYDMRVYNRAASTDEIEALYFGQAITGLRIVKWVEKR